VVICVWNGRVVSCRVSAHEESIVPRPLPPLIYATVTCILSNWCVCLRVKMTESTLSGWNFHVTLSAINIPACLFKIIFCQEGRGGGGSKFLFCSKENGTVLLRVMTRLFCSYFLYFFFFSDMLFDIARVMWQYDGTGLGHTFVYLFTCLFNDAVSSSDWVCMSSDGWVVSE
jgi:hypothetical protein